MVLTAALSFLLSLLPSITFIVCPFLAIFAALYIPLPSALSDKNKLYPVELFVRLTGEYAGELVEMIAGPEVRNSYARLVMGFSFHLPFSLPAGIEYDWIEIAGVPVRLMRPAKREERREMPVVYIHGGGWATMKPNYYDFCLGFLVRKLGCTIFAVGYRLAPEHPFPAGLDDCEAVVRALDSDKLREFGLSADKLVLMGDSAGGNLTAVTTRRLRDDNKIKCQVLIYPVTSVFSFSFPSYREYFTEYPGTALLNPYSMARWILFYVGLDAHVGNVKKLIRGEHIPRNYSKLLDNVQNEFEKASDKFFPDQRLTTAFAKRGLDPDVSPLYAPDLKGLPPTMVLTAGIDVLRDEGQAYARRLASEGVVVDDKHYPTAYHGIMNMPYSSVRKQMQNDIVAFLEKHAT